MASRSAQARTIAGQLLDDEDLHEQIGRAVANLRAVRARFDRRGLQAAQDKKTYARLREALRSLLVASRLIRDKPAPRRRGRKLALVGAGAVAAVAAATSSGRARGALRSSKQGPSDRGETP